MADKIIVLDFGSQYNQLIARRIREFGVYSELHTNEMTLEEIKELFFPEDQIVFMKRKLQNVILQFLQAEFLFWVFVMECR